MTEQQKDNVKLLGRTFFRDNQLFLALSASGVEFTMTGTKLSITLTGDNIVSEKNTDNYARIAIYVNSKCVVDDMVDEAEKTYSVIDSLESVNAVVRIIKLSEAAMSTVGIKEIITDAKDGLRPTKPKCHRIEFIGDSITCGYGTEDEDKNHNFKTSTENATKTYAYMTADALDADYSIVSYSGYGICSGYSNDGETPSLSQLVPTYYENIAFSYGRYNGSVETTSIYWDFTQFEPELIVVNLGTNDDSYCGNYLDRQNNYRDKYVEFLKVIRKNNPNSMILCTLGIMGDRLCPKMEEAVAIYANKTKDKCITTMRFSPQRKEDGYAADFHPSQVTHKKAADTLTESIRNIMKW